MVKIIAQLTFHLELNMQLNHENQKLLNKLVDISAGRVITHNGPAAYKKRHLSNLGPRSLNISVRRKENERIERENHAMAKRLFQNTGNIKKIELDRLYEESKVHGDRIRRVKKMLPGLKLKPLQNELQFSSTKKTNLSGPRINSVQFLSDGENSPDYVSITNEKNKY
jgi:hypothetical protein